MLYPSFCTAVRPYGNIYTAPKYPVSSSVHSSRLLLTTTASYSAVLRPSSSVNVHPVQSHSGRGFAVSPQRACQRTVLLACTRGSLLKRQHCAAWRCCNASIQCISWSTLLVALVFASVPSVPNRVCNMCTHTHTPALCSQSSSMFCTVKVAP